MKNLGIFCMGILFSQFGYGHTVAQPITQNMPSEPGLIPNRIVDQIIPSIEPTVPATTLSSPELSPVTLPQPTPEQSQAETAPVTLPRPTPEQLQLIINNALSNTAVRYTWITNPTDRLTFPAGSFNPLQAENYIDVDLRTGPDNPNLVRLTYGSFPRGDQFYWVLPDNRIVIETVGTQGGLIAQGRGRAFDFLSSASITRALFGVQVVTTLPEVFQEITNDSNVGNFTIRSIAAQVISPEGIPAPPVQINSGTNSTNATNLPVGTGNTNSSFGGIANFDFLDATNVPRVLQAYPTVNLQSLLQAGGGFLRVGTVLSDESLSALSFSLDSPASSDLGGVSSFPAIKILQADRFDNRDLLKILTDPTLDGALRQFHYLNSLFWTDLGLRAPEFSTFTNQARGGVGNNRWYRFYFSRPLRQALLQFDSQQLQATFRKRFSNPGISISFSPDLGNINSGQSLNQTLGLGLGLFFQIIDPDNLQEQVDSAKQQRDDLQRFSPLQTTATPEQRRQINTRLNNSLFFSNLSSGLEQVSGSLTLSGQITPNESSILELRTGLHRRVAQFTELDISPLVRGQNTISLLRLSDNRFGPLTFIGSAIPREQTSFAPNESFASEVVVTAPDGRQFVQAFNSADNQLVTIPIGINRLAMAFDRIEITRTDRQRAQSRDFLGSISLPTIELAYSNSIGDFTYSVSSGFWFNTSPNSAGNVNRNDLGQREPTFGGYASAFATITSTSLEIDENNRLIGVNTMAPLLRLFVTTGNNSNNSSFASLSYTFARQTQNMNFSVVPGVFFGGNGDLSRIGVTPFLQGNFDLNSGFRLLTSLEFGSNLVASVEVLQHLDTNWGIGAFYRNFREINLGVESRTLNTDVYGLLARFHIPRSAVSIEGQVGFGNNNTDVRIRGNFRF